MQILWEIEHLTRMQLQPEVFGFDLGRAVYETAEIMHGAGHLRAIGDLRLLVFDFTSDIGYFAPEFGEFCMLVRVYYVADGEIK